jgi:hypothetical protein
MGAIRWSKFHAGAPAHQSSASWREPSLEANGLYRLVEMNSAAKLFRMPTCRASRIPFNGWEFASGTVSVLNQTWMCRNSLSASNCSVRADQSHNCAPRGVGVSPRDAARAAMSSETSRWVRPPRSCFLTNVVAAQARKVVCEYLRIEVRRNR